MSEYKFITDHQSKMVQAKREGWKKGCKETRKIERQEFLSQLKSGKSLDELIKLYS